MMKKTTALLAAGALALGAAGSAQAAPKVQRVQGANVIFVKSAKDADRLCDKLVEHWTLRVNEVHLGKLVKSTLFGKTTKHLKSFVLCYNSEA